MNTNTILIIDPATLLRLVLHPHDEATLMDQMRFISALGREVTERGPLSSHQKLELAQQYLVHVTLPADAIIAIRDADTRDKQSALLPRIIGVMHELWFAETGYRIAPRSSAGGRKLTSTRKLFSSKTTKN